MITTVTTTAAAATMAGPDIGLMAVISLIVLLIVKELVGASVASGGGVKGHSTVAAVDRVLTVGIVPLLFVFGFIVVHKVVQILGG